MLTRRYAFFCVFLGFNLMADFIPGLSNLTLGGLPLLILVSGWKYGFYYFLITMIPDIPFLVQRIPVVLSLLKIAEHPDMIRNLVDHSLSINSTTGAMSRPLTPTGDIVFGIVGTGALVLSILIMYNSYKGLKLYVQLLRRARDVARHHVR